MSLVVYVFVLFFREKIAAKKSNLNRSDARSPVFQATKKTSAKAATTLGHCHGPVAAKISAADFVGAS